MEAVADKVRALAQGADEATRKAIISLLLELVYSIETADDTITRIWGGHLTQASIRVGIDLKLFTHLTESSTPLGLDKLASLTGAESALLGRLSTKIMAYMGQHDRPVVEQVTLILPGRICRHLASLSMIKETGVDEFGSSHITPALAAPGNQGCLKHYFDSCGPVYQAMPAFLAKTGYRNPTDSHATVFQDAWKCKENCFEWMMSRPENFANFNAYMASRRAEQISWIQHYPVAEQTATGLAPERALFVDVGGGIGHQCAEFRAAYPDLPGRVILQDLPFAVEHAVAAPGLETMAHDFMTPQPIKGAKFYYMRGVLHDWPDAKCQVILGHIKDALAPDSVILIDDIVAPDQAVNWQVCQIDLTMMAAGASIERTRSQWQALFDSVGLRIADRRVYTPGVHETITAVVPK